MEKGRDTTSLGISHEMLLHMGLWDHFHITQNWKVLNPNNFSPI